MGGSVAMLKVFPVALVIGQFCPPTIPYLLGRFASSKYPCELRHWLRWVQLSKLM